MSQQPRKEECQDQVTLALFAQVQECAISCGSVHTSGELGRGDAGPHQSEVDKTEWVRGQESRGEKWMTSKFCYANQ